MKTFVKSGDVLDFTAPYDVASGAGFQVGSLFAVAMDAALNGAAVVGKTTGVFDLVKVGSQAWSVGDKVYWDNGNKRCTTVATDGMLIGAAVAAVDNASGSTTGRVKLNEGVPATAEGPQAAIADLVAITGGESPTEAEHNAVITAFNTLLAELRAAGIIAP